MTIGITAVVACAVVVTGLGVVRASAAELPFERDSALTGALSAQLERSLDPSLRYQINEFDPVTLGAPAFGLALQLERDHVRAGVGPWGETGVMPFRVVSDQQADATLWFVASEPAIAAFSELPGATVRASFDARSPDEAQRADRLEAELLQMLCTAGRTDLRPLLFARWGHTVLKLMPDLPADMSVTGAVQRPAAACCGDRATSWHQRLRHRAATTTLHVTSGHDSAAQMPVGCV